ncbi:helix-turn-helix transcriptional regulator [Vagococcus coleopterorum]|uniref:Helix-turn-helix transcriptional regulator n=1 Tax=Vagococcus coleopterorum TaxID=2714946 RepID=A0A6G8AL77_9ENTE|nr:helix-turn-helix transcriptional regulator [Vagococcus coleopterorum]QIL45844.1 helix-turn-helix transcriptional regulator [Vagococcus coleopterorum]
MSNNVKQWRESLNLSRQELADLVGVSRQTIYFIETKQYKPSIDLAHNLAQVFQTTIEDIFFFTD